VLPAAGSLQFLSQQPMELQPHLDYPLRHRFHVLLPLLEKLGIAEDRRDLFGSTILNVTITPWAPTRLTNRAPCAGGVLICVLMVAESFLHTLNVQSGVGQTICNAPTRSPYNPAFLEKLCWLTPRVDLVSNPFSARRGRWGI
jgi:hypothetical protein